MVTKYFLAIMAVLGNIISADSQHRTGLTIKLDEVNSKYFRSNYEPVMKEAFTIMNAVFNAKDFQDRLLDTSFPCINRCEGCDYDGDCGISQAMVTGEEVLDSIFKELEVTLKVTLKRKSWAGALGETCPGNYSTTAYLKNITNDMEDLPVAYALAANLCHEYLHHVGFCHIGISFETDNPNHPNPEAFAKDITYRIGWEVYYLLIDWRKGNASRSQTGGTLEIYGN